MDVCQDVTQIRQSPKVIYFEKWKKPIKTNSYSSNFRSRSNRFWTWLFSLCDAMNALMWSTSCWHSLRLYCSWFTRSWSARIRVVIGRNGAISRVSICLLGLQMEGRGWRGELSSSYHDNGYRRIIDIPSCGFDKIQIRTLQKFMQRSCMTNTVNSAWELTYHGHPRLRPSEDWRNKTRNEYKEGLYYYVHCKRNSASGNGQKLVRIPSRHREGHSQLRVLTSINAKVVRLDFC